MVSAFTAGAAIMSVELAAARMLSPGFGSGLSVWGALIGVIMGALSLGYYLGGKLADEKNEISELYKAITYAAILVALLTVYGPPTVGLLSFTGLVVGPLIASILLFLPPLMLLSMTSPMVIKFLTKSLGNVGYRSGSVYAISTVGSIAGTFATAFVLLPMLGTKNTLLLNALVLFAFGAYGVSQRWNTLMILFFAPVFLAGPLINEAVIYEGESQYNKITVKDVGDMRVLGLNWEYFFIQSKINKSGIITNSYFDYMSLGPLLNDAQDSLWLGMGAGACIRQLRYFYPDLGVDAVEIDPKVVEVAKRYFYIEEDDRLSVYVADGRMFLREAKQYDLIYLDMFSGADIPAHLATKEFYELTDEHLTSDGVLMMNVLSMKDNHIVVNALSDTLLEVYPSVFVSDIGGNTIVVATKQAHELETLKNRLSKNREPMLKKTVQVFSDGLIRHSKSGDNILTDDRSNIGELTFQLMRDSR